jgi:hypothetical protein
MFVKISKFEAVSRDPVPLQGFVCQSAFFLFFVVLCFFILKYRFVRYIFSVHGLPGIPVSVGLQNRIRICIPDLENKNDEQN